MIDEILEYLGLLPPSSPDSPASPSSPSSPDSPASPAPPSPREDTEKEKSKFDKNENKFVILEKSGFKKELEGVKINEILYKNFRNFCDYLIKNDLTNGNITLNDDGGVRSPKTAHLWSTAWSIRNDKVPLMNLKNLPDGKDLDGNLWYVDGETMEDAKKRAITYWKGAQAAEGYRDNDPRKKPNTFKGVSNHCSGNAIDATIPWKNGDGWHKEANEAIDKFSLQRPVPKERWHFELKH